uniref:Uncharacterized protein n=1 Tax=Arundo donax TaxID=35708 RepID=A0A0A9DG63_ARUDO
MEVENISASGPAVGSNRDRAVENSSLSCPKHRHSSFVDCSGPFFSPGNGGSGASAPSLSHVQGSGEASFFTEFGEVSWYEVSEVVCKVSYGVVAAAVDTRTGKRVAIK